MDSNPNPIPPAAGPIRLKYSTTGKAQPPRPIKLQVPGWGGSPELKMINGSSPQPWHCPPFVEGSTYGLELVYHYETEAHVYYENGDLKIDWDYAKEPGGVMGPDEFGVFAPLPSKYYFFATLVDIQVPPGYVLRTQPHPRFYTDHSGSVPAAIVGHVQTQWWPKKLFVVFKAPDEGKRHVFRQGEGYVQLLVVPQKAEYELEPMSAEENQGRRQMEQNITMSKSFIARDVWQDVNGSEFNDHYRTLGRAYAKDPGKGLTAVASAVDQGVREVYAAVPPNKSVAEYLEISFRHQQEGKILEAREALFYARRLDPNNAEVVSRLGIVASLMGLPQLAAKMMRAAATMHPDNPAYCNNLGVALRRLGQSADAEAAFRAAVRLRPNDPLMLSNLALTLSDQAKGEEALAVSRSALATGAEVAAVQYRAGVVLARVGRLAEARSSFEAALRLDPNFAQARRALEDLAQADLAQAGRLEQPATGTPLE